MTAGNKFSARAGSALLIVLGMLVFMVISSVAFAIFMRESRMPSSYLRRTAANRYLLKAALANAIARIDGDVTLVQRYSDEDGSYRVEGIYDDPYPGMNDDETHDRNYHDRNGDYWHQRVFMPFGEVRREQTVSTLTLEGLAYLPPAIINEVRVNSRLTRTAQWKSLAFDAGRYAFTAVDVSDCFDINKVQASARRFSSDRVNISSLYEDLGSDLDRALAKAGSDPFVSVADFNIAAGKTRFTPFCEFIGDQSGRYIYTEREAAGVSNALFITDTYFPPEDKEGLTDANRFDLRKGGKNQPFTDFSINALEYCARNVSGVGSVLEKNLGVGYACLYDYLDGDSKPISYAIPTVETAAMVCGLGLAHGGKYHLELLPGDKVTGEQTTQSGSKQWEATLFSLNLKVGAHRLVGTAAFPFKRAQAKDYCTSFKASAAVKVCLGTQNFGCRLSPESPLGMDDQSGWATATDARNCILTLGGSAAGTVDFGDVITEEEAVKQFLVDIPAGEMAMPVYWKVAVKELDGDGNTVSSEEYFSLDGIRDEPGRLMVYSGSVNDEGIGLPSKLWEDALKAATRPRPTGGAGEPPEKVENLPGQPLLPHVFAWVRLENDDGEVVDVAPARLMDDIIWGERNTRLANAGLGMKFGEGYPVLEFRGRRDRAVVLSEAETTLDGTSVDFEWDELYCVDPRFNFAGEDWFAKRNGSGAAGGEPTAQKWLNMLDDVLGSNAGGFLRDNDIFMFTSDQEYLQSIGELQCLPWLQPLQTERPDNTVNTLENQFLSDASLYLVMDDARDMANRFLGDANATLGSAIGKAANNEYFWRTYSQFNGDDVYHLYNGNGSQVEIISGTGDFRVNPYSQDPRIMMSVLRDTPFDWFVASTNRELNTTYDMKASEADKYAFHPNNASAMISDEKMEVMANYLRCNFAYYACINHLTWEEAYDRMAMPEADTRRMNWIKRRYGYNFEDIGFFDEGDGAGFLGVKDLDQPLSDLDRKFLYAFWHDCFQNRQHLFLVFVRAEPVGFGGSDAQSGVRGVALVWRDPAKPKRPEAAEGMDMNAIGDPTAFKSDYRPHRTRVLFYHQFD